MYTPATSTRCRFLAVLVIAVSSFGVSQATAAGLGAFSFAKSSSGSDGSSPVQKVRLFELSPETGAQTELGTVPLGNFSSAQATFDPLTGRIVALLDRGNSPRVAVLDPENLHVVAVNPMAHVVAGIAADPFAGGILVAHGTPLPNRLGVVNPNNGELQDQGAMTFPVSGVAIDLLAFAPDGVLYAFEHRQSQQDMRLWRVDRATRVATLVGTTPNKVKDFDDAMFLGDDLWVLRSSDNSLLQISTADASVLATVTTEQPKKHGLAPQGCVAPSADFMAQDQKGDSGGAIALDWTSYQAPVELVRFEIVRSLDGCAVAAGGGTLLGSVAAGNAQTFVDDSVDDYKSYYYGIRVIVEAQGVDAVAEQLQSGAAAAFPNVLINEFAPAGGVSKAGANSGVALVGEFIELFNLAPDPIDLTGWLLSNGTETEPLSGIIPGNGLFVHTLAVIDLPDAGGVFQLLPPGGTSFIIDDVAYGSEGGAPTAPAGFTINRVEGTDSSTPDEKAFATSTPTPGQTNSAAPPHLGSSLVLNEVYYQGVTGQDYIELFNPTGGTIALRRFAISDGVGFIDTLDTNLDVAPGAWFVLNANSTDPFTRNLVANQLYLYKITESGLFELVDHLGWGPGIGDPPPPQPDAANTNLVRNADGDALYIGDVGTNWLDCGGNITLFYGPASPGGPNTSPQQPSILVDQSGNGDFTTITAALAAATPGVRILVAPGTYEERFNLVDRVSIAGIGPLPADVIVTGPGGHTPIQAFGVGSTTEVSRLSIRGGYAADDGPFAQTPASGGGLRVVSGSPVFKNVRFEYNIAINNGGAIAIAGGSPTFDGCMFLNNYANDHGGAVWVADGTPSFRSCLFVGNTSKEDGGVVFMQGGTLNFEQCVMDNNEAGGAGIIHATGGNTFLQYSMITNSLFGDALSAVAPAAITFGCGLIYNPNEEAATTSSTGAVTMYNTVGGDPLYCQPLAFNYAYPDASPVRQLSSVCAEVIGVAGAPCGQVLTASEEVVPRRTTLHTPYPNPFNPTVVLRFDLAREGRAEVTVFDVRGRRVAELLGGGLMAAGSHQTRWNGVDDAGRTLATGIYFARLRLDGVDHGAVRKMVLLK